MGRSVDPPPHIRTALHALFGADVDAVRVVEYSRFARLHGRAIATTRRRAIYLRGSAEDFFSDPGLMLHEYCHVLHQWESGALTSLAYLREWMRCGYWRNRFEVEARTFASRNLQRFHQLLRGAPDQPSSASRR